MLDRHAERPSLWVDIHTSHVVDCVSMVTAAYTYEPDEPTIKPKKTRAPRKPKEASSAFSSTQAFVSFYDAHIRPCAPSDKLGIYIQIERLMRDGLTAEQLQTALSCYANDPYRKSGDIRFTKRIRSFFNKVTILEWQRPMATRSRVSDDRLAALDRAATAPRIDVARPSIDRFQTKATEETHEDLQP